MRIDEHAYIWSVSVAAQLGDGDAGACKDGLHKQGGGGDGASIVRPVIQTRTRNSFLVLVLSRKAAADVLESCWCLALARGGGLGREGKE